MSLPPRESFGRQGPGSGPVSLTNTTPEPGPNRHSPDGFHWEDTRMPGSAVDRIRVTTVVDNYIDNLRQDDAVARRYSAFVAVKMPDLRAEHGLAHLVEVTRG